MSKKVSIERIGILSILLLLISACGSVSGSGGSHTANHVPTHGNLYVLAGSANQDASSASLQIVSFQPGSTNLERMLPNGLTSLDHQRLYTAVARQGSTTISVIRTSDAGILRSFSLPGVYTTSGTMFDHAVLSFDGHWLALRALPVSTNSTTLALIDTQAGKLSKTIQLVGDFDLDAISPDGSRIYLLQRLHDGTSHYYVRLYQVDHNQLFESPIVDKSEIGGSQMNGEPLVRQVAADGSKVFTLYIDPHQNIAFIHILPLTGDYPGARCIDLPVGNDPGLLHYYTLALHTYKDGSATLYAANGALGSVTTVNIVANDQVFSINAQASVRFAPGRTAVSTSTRGRLLYNGATLTPDGQTLFFAGLQGVWSVKTSDLSEQLTSFNTYLSDRAFTSLGLSSDGGTLYALDPAYGILTLDARTYQAGQVLHAPVATARGIGWIES